MASCPVFTKNYDGWLPITSEANAPGTPCSQQLWCTKLICGSYAKARPPGKTAPMSLVSARGSCGKSLSVMLSPGTRLKRGGPDSIRITLDEALDFYDRREMSVSAVDEALQSLEEIDPRQGQIVEMRFFGGLTIEEIAKAIDVSSATVKREWTFAKVWLRRELSR